MRIPLIAFFCGLLIAAPVGYFLHSSSTPPPSPAVTVVGEQDEPSSTSASTPALSVPAQSDRPIGVYFSPSGGCTASAVAELNSAQKSIDVQAYSFTSAPIAQAIVDAKGRGVAVRVILDKSNQTAKYSAGTFLVNHGVQTWIDSKHAIAHNKIMLIDGKTIITGSFNFTAAAEKSNAENMLVIRDSGWLLGEYERNFAAHLAHSVPYAKPQ